MVARRSSSFNCITLTLLVLPAIVIAVYFLTSFPHVPESVVIHPSLASLNRTNESNVAERVKAVYPEDFWEKQVQDGDGRSVDVEGRYVSLPLGRTRYWVMGPEDGTKVSYVQVCASFISVSGAHICL